MSDEKQLQPGAFLVPCPTCHGTGSFLSGSSWCPTCNGNRELEVVLAARVAELEAEVARLRQRTHEIQEQESKRNGALQAEAARFERPYRYLMDETAPMWRKRAEAAEAEVARLRAVGFAARGYLVALKGDGNVVVALADLRAALGRADGWPKSD